MAGSENLAYKDRFTGRQTYKTVLITLLAIKRNTFFFLSHFHSFSISNLI